MFYRFYIFYGSHKIDASIQMLLTETFSDLFFEQDYEDNLYMLIFTNYNQTIDPLLHVAIQQTLQTLFEDTSTPLFCFTSQLFQDMYPADETFPTILTYIKEIPHALESNYFITSQAKVLSTMYIQSQEASFFEEYTQFSQLKKQQILLLQTLLSLNNNISASSSLLYLHRNTINYQLQKITQLTGFDIRQLDDQLLFQLFIFVHGAHRI